MGIPEKTGPKGGKHFLEAVWKEPWKSWPDVNYHQKKTTSAGVAIRIRMGMSLRVSILFFM